MRRSSKRETSDESYIIDLCDAVLGRTAKRQHRFDFLVGDPDKRGRCSKLPVDAYYEDIGLVVEYMERQHSQDTPFFDKPEKITVSGVHRGKQRQLYDERRAEVLPKNGITLVRLSLSDFFNRSARKLLRHREQDEKIVREKLAPFLSDEGSFDKEYLEKLRAHHRETRDLFSNKRKPERERMVVRAFLRCLGVTFEDAEIRVGGEEPVDVSFQTARFQVRETLGGYKRGTVLKERQKQYEAAKSVADTLVPVTWPTPISYAEITQIVAAELADKATHYGVTGCSKLDALLSVAIRRNLYPLEATPDLGAVAELEKQGWRSVSIIFLPYSVVITARPDAPDFLKERTHKILGEWPDFESAFEA